MIFKQVLVDQILAGNKTMTRRPVDFENPRGHYWHERCRYRPGMRFNAQANYKAGMRWPKLEVVAVRRERWRDITEADAIAEGFVPGYVQTPLGAVWRSAREAFFDYVQKLYPDLDLNAEVWVIEFKLVDNREGKA